MNFIEMLPQIRYVAAKMCKKWGNIFAVDELVNEAWIKSIDKNHIDAPLIIKTAKCDMVDYIRMSIGRNNYISKKTGNVTSRPKHVTNYDSYWQDNSTIENTRGNSIFDGEFTDPGFDEIDNKELIDIILSKVTYRKAVAMVNYYLEEHNLVTSGEIMGISNSHFCNILKSGRAEFLKAVGEMELNPSDILRN